MIKYFAFVLASFGDTIYYDFIKMRKLQFLKYNIPNAFLFDDEFPATYTKDENDFFFEKVKSPYPNDDPTWMPHMTIKFLNALPLFDLSEYDFIIKVNLSTFVNFRNLENTMLTLPRSHLFAGSLATKFEENTLRHALHGGCTIFTYDTIQFLKQRIDANVKMDHYIYTHLEDVAISYIVHPYAWPFFYFNMLWFDDRHDYNEQIKHLNKYYMYRIRHGGRHHDVNLWRILLKKFDQIEYTPLDPIAKSIANGEIRV